MARPRAKIDQVQFEKLCSLMCTEAEIADFFGVSVDTVDRWCKRTYGAGFADTYNKKSSKGKIALRRYQLQLAEKNAAMAIFLGKQWLGQNDVQSVNANVNMENPLSCMTEKELRALAETNDTTAADDSG